ncbi:MAG: M23 family metallopeptidase [Gordonia sp. (in: high G+C Gram-positive bacteria)]|uniref:M23 family metallopeptidase n=1 Tax=Gordonia sp. (in: high G+C Gram-positive bacteria) TaxID=84139 RepID=UPI0039E3ACFA
MTALTARAHSAGARGTVLTDDAKIDSLMTRDIPLPPRDLRLGLSSTTLEPSRTRTSTADTVTTLPRVDSTAVKIAASSARRGSATAVTDTVPVTKAEPMVIEPTAPAAPAPATESGTVKTGPRKTTRTKHRATPPAALKARTALVAVAAGAAAAAVAGSGTQPTEHAAPKPEAAPVPLASTADAQGGAVPAASTSDMDGFTAQLAEGKRIAAAKAAAENAARRPLYESPIPIGAYTFTSGFGERWGSFHGGLDFAAPLGTPIHAVTDGEVVEAGPASGYGNWIQIKAADGTITMYGHMASSGVLVSKGQHVTAGDVIALVGSEGFSTGPHCHFEVWKNGVTKIDPAPWLAAHGVRMSAYTG